MSSEVSPPAASPGWYSDGEGRQRWWDGQHWTDNYAPIVVAQKPLSGIGIAGFIVAVVALLLSSLPVLFGLILSLTGLVLSIGGWTDTNGERKRGRGFALAGIIVGAAAVLAVIGWQVLRAQNGLT